MTIESPYSEILIGLVALLAAGIGGFLAAGRIISRSSVSALRLADLRIVVSLVFGGSFIAVLCRGEGDLINSIANALFMIFASWAVFAAAMGLQDRSKTLEDIHLPKNQAIVGGLFFLSNLLICFKG